MWYNSHFIKYGVRILLVLLILYFLILIIPSLYPIFTFIFVFFSPVVLGVVLYYIFRPYVDFLENHGLPRLLAIMSVFLLLGLILVVIATFVAPKIFASIQEVANVPSSKIGDAKNATMGLLDLFNFNLSYEHTKDMLLMYIPKAQQFIVENTLSILSTLTHTIIIFVITPFCLFYLLRDDKRIKEWFLEYVPNPYQEKAVKVLGDFDKTLYAFFHGQITIALVVTALTFFGLLTIGIDNVAILTFITFLLSLIPFLGTFLAIFPPVALALTHSYIFGAATAAMMIGIHLIESNLITPQVMMKRLDLHPLMVILLVVASFSVFGFTGPFWITPLYVIIRELVLQAIDFYYPEIEPKRES